jgi:hypothetical protein
MDRNANIPELSGLRENSLPIVSSSVCWTTWLCETFLPSRDRVYPSHPAAQLPCDLVYAHEHVPDLIPTGVSLVLSQILSKLLVSKTTWSI